ncbi:hypothetical protein GCM10027275_05060 [Rhabdobacter roseus]
MIIGLAGLVSACKDDDEEIIPTPNTITDIVLTNNDFTILRAAVQHAGLGDALRTGSLTVFAPTDQAFIASGFANAAAITALPAATVKSVLEYHVLASRVPSSGINDGSNQEVTTLQGSRAFVTKNASGVSINGARVVTADVNADNGVIHVIDHVIMPPSQNLLEIAQGNSDFSLLVAAATRAAAGNPVVLEALTSDAGAFTVFAPTNQAFIDAGFANEAAFNAVEPAALATIILYHVVPGRVFSTNLAAGDVATANGDSVAVNLTNGVNITGNGNGGTASSVTSANMLATNGVVHVIDRVLLP